MNLGKWRRKKLCEKEVKEGNGVRESEEARCSGRADGEKEKREGEKE